MKLRLILLSSLLGLAVSCSNENDNLVEIDPAKSNDTKPDYAMVFPQDRVNTIEITLGKSNWDAIVSNMRTIVRSEFGSTASPKGGGQAPSNTGGAEGGTNSLVDPMYVDAIIKFNGKTWSHVGFRLKGNSSLAKSWSAGTYKLPFRLKMDEFEEKYPETMNQRIYGFKDLTFSPAYSDQSLVREKLGADLFESYGVKAARTSFCRLVIDFGEGPKYCGVYTLVEVIDDTMVENKFGAKSGNIYKPESDFKTFNQSLFEKKNNELTPDYSDVQNFVKALNASNRKTDPTSWRAELEKQFNMADYLKFLAVSNSIVNWDTYGAVAHNFYFYNDPFKKITWIPWDHNNSMMNGPRPAVSLPLTEGTDTWPLLKFVKEDDVYFNQYKSYVKDFNTKILSSGKATELLNKYSALISPYVNGAEKEVVPYSQLKNSSEFPIGTESLRRHINNRISAVNTFAP
ncbi:MAG: CotH kinase family protein [Leadbetterella sp.]